ncbi:MAG: DNA-3-methyladenine glycosylase 2 [Firmicutes bacterium]|nr:DNA-3-methyladenine glycosylase 2 [Bacillota bacterium]
MAETRITVSDLNLPATLLSGQAFRWSQGGDWFSGYIDNMAVQLKQEGPGLIIRHDSQDAGHTAVSVCRYLDLDRDYEAIRTDVADRLPELRPALEFSRGLRVLRQDPWEALVCFIVSQNNNVPRITRCVGNVCSMCSPMGAFPSSRRLAVASDEDLRRAGLGYRAPYLRAAARMVDSGDLDLEGLRRLPVEEARRTLMGVPGVGGKVADCVLLYGLQKYEVVPVDVWILRVVEALFFSGRSLRPEQARSWAVQNFGPYAGIIQA